MVGVALRDQGTYPLRLFALMKEVRDGRSGDNFLGGKDIIYQNLNDYVFLDHYNPVFPKSGRFLSQRSFLLELL